MSTTDLTGQLQEAEQDWQERTLKPALKQRPESKKTFTTTSLTPVERLYTPNSLPNFDYETNLGFPGEPPYTRGIHPTGYRGKLWTMRQFAGFGSAFDTNRRFKYLLEQGQTGLSVAFDLPTLMGYDSDHAVSEGEVGKCGVAISSLADMEALFDGIPLEQVTTSMTINAPASMIFAMFLAVAEKQGADWRKVGGTLQNDILKEYIAQKEWIYPPRPSMRLITDVIQFCTAEVPRFNPVSISGYHIREAGSTALQELAFTLRDGIEYVQYAIDAGMQVDEFAPRLSFFFNSHNDFFEEIAKFRAARRIWYRVMKDRFGARSARSWTLRFHTQTAGVSLTAQQPLNNIMRVAIQALAGVLGGTQSLRTQQIIAHESGVANTIDPLGGSYYLEKLTDDMEQGAFDYFRKIDGFGGMVEAIDAGFPQRETQDASYEYQKAVESREKVIVGVNEYVLEEDPTKIPLLQIDGSVADLQKSRLEKLRLERDSKLVAKTLDSLTAGAAGGENTMPLLVDCARAYATLGEMCDALRPIFGEYREPMF
jgi:methylmalonyl-CoA mutase N-terminal domain/subunit